MATHNRSLIGLLPAVLLLAFAGYCGTFDRGASFSGAALAALLAIGVATWGRWGDLDPLRLGAWGRLLPVGLWLTLLAGTFLSPVPRAGRVAIALLPAFLSIPAATARALEDEAARRVGLRALRAGLSIVAGWGLIHWLATGAPRAAMPLGHHNLYAGVLVALLPGAAIGLRRTERPSDRALALGATALALAGIAASGSLLAAAAVGVQALLSLLWKVRLQKLLLPSALLILALQMPRVAAIFRGEDVSTRARLAYLEAGWKGLAERPWFGWGAGSTPWTIGLHMKPIAGVHPPGEIIGDLHSLPLQILYELGGVGFAFTLGTAAYFLRRRIRERPQAGDATLLAAGLIGLLGAAVTRLGGASLSILAVPAAVALSAGLALAGGRPREVVSSPRPLRPIWVWAGVIAALSLVGGPLLGSLRYAQARRATSLVEARGRLGQARQVDPGFPWYSLIAARLMSDVGAPGASTLARWGAKGAPGVAAGWLIAGDAAAREGDLEPAREAWRRASDLDPLGGAAPALRLAWRAETVEERVGWLTRALVAEPRFLASEPAEAIALLLPEALRRIEADASIDAGWRERFLVTARALEAMPRSARLDALEVEVDGVPVDALSLHAFRRLPWPAALAPVAIDRTRARRVEEAGLTAATTLPRGEVEDG